MTGDLGLPLRRCKAGRCCAHADPRWVKEATIRRAEDGWEIETVDGQVLTVGQLTFEEDPRREQFEKQARADIRAIWGR